MKRPGEFVLVLVLVLVLVFEIFGEMDYWPVARTRSLQWLNVSANSWFEDENEDDQVVRVYLR